MRPGMSDPIGQRLRVSRGIPGTALRAGLIAAGFAVLGVALAAAPRDPLKIPSGKVLITTTMTVREGLAATLTEFMTGDKSEKTAINILLGLHRIEGKTLTLATTRDYNAEAGGFVSRSSLLVIDLDRDGDNEILVEYHHNEAVGSTRVDMDIFRVKGEALTLVWSGPVRVDTTNPALGLPPSERERFVREIDYPCTARANGAKLCFTKTASVAAGATLEPPRVVPEEVGFGAPPAPAAPAPDGKAPAAVHSQESKRGR